MLEISEIGEISEISEISEIRRLDYQDYPPSHTHRVLHMEILQRVSKENMFCSV